MGTGTNPAALQGLSGRRCGSFCLDAASSGTARCPPAARGVSRRAGSAPGPCPGGRSEHCGAAPSPAALAVAAAALPPGPATQAPNFPLCAARSGARRGSPARPRLLIGQRRAPPPPPWRWSPPPGGRLLSPQTRVGSVRYQGSAPRVSSAPPGAAPDLLNLSVNNGFQECVAKSQTEGTPH